MSTPCDAVPAPRRAGRPQRRPMPSSSAMHDALTLARRVAQVEARLASIRAQRAALVLRLRDDEGLSQLEVAELLGVTKARVQQIEREARAGDDTGGSSPAQDSG